MSGAMPPNVLDISRLPPDDGLNTNEVARRCGLSREDVKAMIGVLEKQAGLLPQRTDAQGNQQRIVSESLLLPYFQTAAYVMRTERRDALTSMEKTLHIGAQYYLEQLTQITTHLHSLRTMPRELRDAARELEKAAKIPRTVSIQGVQQVQWALDDLAANLRRWQMASGVLFVLLLIVVLALFWSVTR